MSPTNHFALVRLLCFECCIYIIFNFISFSVNICVTYMMFCCLILYRPVRIVARAAGEPGRHFPPVWFRLRAKSCWFPSIPLSVHVREPPGHTARAAFPPQLHSALWPSNKCGKKEQSMDETGHHGACQRLPETESLSELNESNLSTGARLAGHRL